MSYVKLLCLLLILNFTTASSVEFFTVNSTSVNTNQGADCCGGYFAIDNNLNTYWQPSFSSTGNQILSLSFASPQVLGNLTWVISSITSYNLTLYDTTSTIVGGADCPVGACKSTGETVMLPSTSLVAKVEVRLNGINNLPTAQKQSAILNFKVFELFAIPICETGVPFDFSLGQCNDTCGIVPDPYRYGNIPSLNMQRVKLTTDGILSLSFDMGGVQSRVITYADISGSDSCSAAITVPWQESTRNNTCDVEIASKYYWTKLFLTCPNNIKFFQSNESETASAWLLIQVQFLENITVNNGARVIPRGFITRDFVAEYSLGVFIARYVVVTAQVNISRCDGIVCPSASQCRNASYCDENTGQCINTNYPDGRNCSDADLCTINDVCFQGTCNGTKKQCNIPPNQCFNSLGVCESSSGNCIYSPKADNSTCDDGNACTTNDTCQAGTCVGKPVVCVAQSQCHNIGVCNVTTGVCSNPPKQNGTSCSDNNLCTLSDYCDTTGNCIGINITCRETTCKFAGTCNPLTGLCNSVNKANGTICDDLNACTRLDACYNGVCIGGNATICTSQDQCKLPGICDASTGKCSSPNKADGSACNNSNPCSVGDTCRSGVCTSSLKTCPPPNQCYKLGTCNVLTGQCQNEMYADGYNCDDGNKCTTNDKCVSGVCSGTPVICTSTNQCKLGGTCNVTTGTCSMINKEDGSPCSSDPCASSNVCLKGVCIGDNTLSCPSQIGQCFSYGVCNATSKTCSLTMKANGTPCNDGNACTKNDTCLAGVCRGSFNVTCTAKDQCHNVGVCDTATGICSQPTKPDNTTCDDNNKCTFDETCQSGKCTSVSFKQCPIVSVCNSTDQCKPDTGECVSTCQPCNASSSCTSPPPCHGFPATCAANGTCVYSLLADGSSCNDSNLCTVGDFCSAGVCISTSNVSCQAIDSCHGIGECNPQTGVCSNPELTDGTSCNDTNLCTQQDICLQGVCIGSNPVICPANDQCHMSGVCQPTTGNCTYEQVTDGTPCNDSLLCTYNDICNAGECQGTPVTCQQGDECKKSGQCDPTTGMCQQEFFNDGTPCSDGDLCSQYDTCFNGTCIPGTPVVCLAHNDCHFAGVCNSTTGTCSEIMKPNGTACNDSDFCTLADECQGGICTSSLNVTCNAVDECHEAGVCDAKTGQCSIVNAVNGKTCNNSDMCQLNSTCFDGVCSGISITCTDLDECHDPGVCNPTTGVCEYPVKQDGTSCNDTNPCTQEDQCHNGICKGSSPIYCPAVTECYEVSTCDSGTGNCTLRPKADGTPCDDGDLCTLGDSCYSGVCVANSTKSCNFINSCHFPGICNPLSGLCNYPNKPNGTACSDSNACTQTDTCQSGVCVGSNEVTCPLEKCNAVGTCDMTTGLCTDPCPPIVTGAIVSQTIRNTFPFIIKFMTFTSKNGTLENGTIVSTPVNGDHVFFTNSSLDEIRSNVKVQYWTLLLTPIGICSLNGPFVFRWDVVEYQGTSATLTFQIESQNFCGQITNTSVAGSIRIFRDSGFSIPTTTFSSDANIYIWISVESAFVVALVEVTAISVNNLTYPVYGVSGETQVPYGIKFAMLALTPPFQFGNNDLAFSVRLTYGAQERGSNANDKPTSISLTKAVGVVVPATSGGPPQIEDESENTENSPQTSTLHPNSILPITLGVGFTVALIIIVIIVVIFRKKRHSKKKTKTDL